MTNSDSFPPEIATQIGWYVYRLIDPRNGETFYVGKGKENRVFAHIHQESAFVRDEIDPKIQRIRDIKLAGFEVAHVIHRHNLTDEMATEVEAALIDAYSGLTNIAGGAGSNDFGVMHAKEIIHRYQAEEAEFRHNVILINISRTALEKSLYNATRYAWKLSLNKAEKTEYVLPTLKGLIVGAFIPKKWMKANTTNFPELGEDDKVIGRIGFTGKEASKEIQELYVNKRVPQSYRRRGAANPVRYSW